MIPKLHMYIIVVIGKNIIQKYLRKIYYKGEVTG
jgi:hypothetical protein